MNIYIVISFVMFLIVDYIYIYNFFDSKLFFTTSGSKLRQVLNKENKNFIKLSLNEILILLICSICIWLINFCVVYSSLSTNSFEISVLSKSLNISAILQEKFKYFKFLYYISSYIFICIILLNNSQKVLRLVRKIMNKNKYDIESVPSANDKKIYIGAKHGEEDLHLSLNSMYQNVLITGSIGSGKTSGAISNITSSLISMGFGGLILDAKGNFVNNVKIMCKKHGRTKDLQIISNTSNCYFEILDNNITAFELASRLRHVIELLSPNNNSDTYWLDKVENVLQNMLILMDYLEDKRSMLELHQLVTSKDYLEQKLTEAGEKLLENVPDDKTCFELNNVILFLKNEFLKLDSRVFSIITSEITRLTIPLITDYDIYKRYLEYTEDKEVINFYENPEKIVVLSINIGENKALCKIISIFLKLYFQKYILSTLKNAKTFPIFFIADEFQEFVNADDSAFFSLSREAKCINVISTQSYTSLRNTLKDTDSTGVILQNFVNKIWFRNDDNYTIAEAIKQLGKAEVKRENTSITENAQESMKYLLQSGFKNRKSSISNGINYVVTKENEFDENFFTRELKTLEALVFLQNDKENIVPKKVKFNIWRENI